MGKLTGVGASLLKGRRRCAIDVNPTTAEQIAHKALIEFGSDKALEEELLHATTLDDIAAALSKAYGSYNACLTTKHQKRAMKIKTFMHKHKLDLKLRVMC